MPERIAGDRGALKHDDEISFFNRLIIDLKLIQLGRQPTEEITMERLEKGTEMVGKLFECRTPTRWR